MSAPDTNIEKQEKRHKGPLIGMGVVVALAVLLLAILTVWYAYDGNEPRDASEPAAEQTAPTASPDTTPSE